MSKKIGTYEARTHWSEVMQDVKKGERYVITHHGEPVAELIPSQTETRQERSKAAAGRLLALIANRKTGPSVDIKDAIEEGRD